MRYVRTTLLTQRLLGIRKLTLGWPAYAFGAEALGQAMLYPEGRVPGTDPGRPLISRKSGAHVPTPDFNSEIPRIIEEMLVCFAQLTGIEPVAHLPAPYSLAADIFGQQALLMALVQDLDFIHALLEDLTERVLIPWIEHLVQHVPNVWIELSDASGSPMFIGPRRCIEVAAPPVHTLIAHASWGQRVFVANYRGDHLFLASSAENHRRGRKRQRRAQSPAPASMPADDRVLAELFMFKRSVCPEFFIKLEADQLPLDVYVRQAIKHALPLYIGIGATRINRQSYGDAAAAKQRVRQLAAEYAQAIAGVSQSLAEQGKPRSQCAWPGDVFIEDINAESDFGLVQAIVEAVAANG